jgi:hypothetical protein
VQTYSTCADPACKGVMMVTYVGQETHPGCRPTKAEQVARKFIDAIQAGNDGEADRLEKELNRAAALPSLGASALWYAQQGWPVFPLLPGTKQPATRHGFKDATTDLDRIKDWWAKHPEANIGLPTGVMFDVIDIDGPEGVKSLAELGDDVLPDIHGKVGSPRGFHFYVKPSGDGNRAGVRPGIDYRGQGGYVVAPPSRLDFKKWQWLVKPSPEIRKGA